MRRSPLLLSAMALAPVALGLGGCSSWFGGEAEPPRAQASPAATPASGAPAQSQLAAAPGRSGPFTTKPGAAYENSYGNTLTVSNVWGNFVEFRDQNDNDYLSYALLYTPNTKLIGNEHVMKAIDGLWPLATGKTAEAWVYNTEWAWKLSWKVLGLERVTVPAGTFDAWLIEHTEESLQGGYVGKSRSWYAPTVGWNVRYRSWQQFPYSTEKPEEWELTAVPRATRTPAAAQAR